FNGFHFQFSAPKAVPMRSGGVSSGMRKMLFLGFAITGTVCTVLGLPLTIAGAVIPAGVLYNYAYGLDQKFVLLAFGITFLVVGVPFMIVGWVLFARLKMREKKDLAANQKIQVVTDYDALNQQQKMGIQIRL
ncbi:MAG: hypothetical protein MJB14_17370, partial [Spirochaetes bacterium]|nr:hypothetical protein [Spirochaetota bacterium]